MLITAFAPLVTSPAFIVFAAIALGQWQQCTNGTIVSSECSDMTSQSLEYAMMGLGFGAIVGNTIYIIVYNFYVMGGCQQMMLYTPHWP